jgi:site-specific DNA recombinase
MRSPRSFPVYPAVLNALKFLPPVLRYLKFPVKIPTVLKPSRNFRQFSTVINRKSDKALADIDKRLEELQTELLKLATSNSDYDKVGDEIHQLRDQKQKLQLESANRDELKKRIADMSAFLKKQSTFLTEYDEQLVRHLIEKVTVYEDKFTVEFKSGVTVAVND